MPEIDYQELEGITEDLKLGLKVGNLSQAVAVLGLLTRYIDGLVEEQNRWKRTEREIIEERRAYNDNRNVLHPIVRRR